MPNFRKKTDLIEAMQWDGENADAVVQWAQGGWKISNQMIGEDGAIWLKQKLFPDGGGLAVWRLVIPTFNGDFDAAPSDWIVRGKGGLSVVTDEAFHNLFEPA